MADIKSFEDLKIWQDGMSVAEDVYAVVQMFPSSKRYSLSDQLRRAVVSIPSNIAEGFGRETKAEFLHFLAMARGSLFEVRTQLELTRRAVFVEDCSAISDKAKSLGRMIYAFMSKLRTSDHR